MKFLLALFFAKTVLLTPHSVDINGELELIPSKPLTVVTSGAGLEIDVTSMIPAESQSSLFKYWDRVSLDFPPESIDAEAFDKDGRSMRFVYEGYSSISNKEVRLNLSREEVPEDSEFVRVVIRSKFPLKAVSVYWRNFKK